jgi:Holliday junction DNA helicase RuvA
MIDHVKGRLRGRGKDHAVVECAGIGFRVTLTAGALSGLPPDGEEVTIRTWLQVREGGADLFGFTTSTERDLFLGLLSVTGVGPRSALAVLSTLGADGVLSAALRGDGSSFARAPGIGKKLAQRIATEMPDVLRKGGLSAALIEGGGEGIAHDTGAAAEAVEALVGLGFARHEVQSVVSRLAVDGAGDSSALVRRALPLLSGGVL